MKTIRKNFLLLAFAAGALFLIGNNVMADPTTPNPDPGGEVDYRCNCGFIWGKNCKANNYGAYCAPIGTAFCRDYDSNCNN
jgi:hypothetical protein